MPKLIFPLGRRRKQRYHPTVGEKGAGYYTTREGVVERWWRKYPSPFRGRFLYTRRFHFPLASTVYGALWLIERLGSYRNPPMWIWWGELDKALGQKTGVTAARCYEKREPVEGKFFRFEKGKAWVPDVIDEVKWVTTEDAMRYIGVQRLRHIDWEHKGFVNAEIRPLRGAVCITVEDLLRLKLWKKVCGKSC